MPSDLIARERADEVAVVGGGTVVAQDEVFVFAEGDGLHIIVGMIGDVGLVDGFAVDVERAVEHRDRVARASPRGA